MGGNLAFLTVSSGYFHGPVLFAQAWTLGNAGGTHTAKCSGDSPRCYASRWNVRAQRKGLPALGFFSATLPWKKRKTTSVLTDHGKFREFENIPTSLQFFG